MAQGEFTKEEGKRTLETIYDMFKRGIPKTRQLNYIGHLNDICLFIEAAIRNAPNEQVKQVEKTST